MRTLRQRSLLLLLTASLTVGAYARQPEAQSLPRPDDRALHFEHLTTEQGLSQGRVTGIVQDRQGFMWFGTHAGLNKYDGYDFKVYYPDPDDANSLAPGFIWALHEDVAGMLWIGTSGGLNRFDPATETFTHFRHEADNPASLSYDYVWSL